MSDDDHTFAEQGRPHLGATSILTPQASAIAGFTFAVLTMTGQGAWTGLAQAFVGTTFAPTRLGSLLASWAVATLLLDALAVYLARRALRAAPEVGTSWPGHLARAAVIVATVAAAVALVTLVATLVRGGF